MIEMGLVVAEADLWGNTRSSFWDSWSLSCLFHVQTQMSNRPLAFKGEGTAGDVSVGVISERWYSKWDIGSALGSWKREEAHCLSPGVRQSLELEKLRREKQRDGGASTGKDKKANLTNNQNIFWVINYHIGDHEATILHF